MQTREILLEVAGELLAEVGIERISTNMVCARAGLTPPALYRYFTNKYALIEALGARLMDRQNDVLIAWIDRYLTQGIETASANVEELMLETARVTDAQPGGVWIERALHATPTLAHIRVASHRFVTDKLTDAYAAHLPHVPRDAIWRRVRVAVELGYVTEELLHEESGISRDKIIAETARLLRFALRDWPD